MHIKELNILPTGLLDEYVHSFDADNAKKFGSLTDSELTAGNFSFYVSVSAVFSSKIEGESIELDSFIKHKRFEVKYKPDYTRKIDDLYDAYLFAQNNILSPQNIAAAHSIITKNILRQTTRGVFRKNNMYVLSGDGKIEYVAALPGIVAAEMNKLYADIELLLKTELSFEETFFFASLLHLVFVKIHPYEDGNGRTARLLEKWFLSQKLGQKAWLIQSEKFYYNNHAGYYRNIRLLGIEYENLAFSKALTFLQMLPASMSAET